MLQRENCESRRVCRRLQLLGRWELELTRFLWTFSKSFSGGSDAVISKRLSARVLASDGRVGPIRANACRASPGVRADRAVHRKLGSPSLEHRRLAERIAKNGMGDRNHPLQTLQQRQTAKVGSPILRDNNAGVCSADGRRPGQVGYNRLLSWPLTLAVDGRARIGIPPCDSRAPRRKSSAPPIAPT